MNTYKKIIIEAAIEEAKDNGFDGTPEAYICDRFQSEMGWNIDRNGAHKAAMDWVQGLALSVPFSNFDIIELGKEAGLVRKNASERACDLFIENYWRRLGGVVYRIHRGSATA